jgi:hypothetical protein
MCLVCYPVFERVFRLPPEKDVRAASASCELARLLVRLNHIARFIRSAAKPKGCRYS